MANDSESYLKINEYDLLKMSKNPLKIATMLFVNSSLNKLYRFINLYFDGLKLRE